jgi:hypothetical protein
MLVRAVFRVTGRHAISYEACHFLIHLINFIILIGLSRRDLSVVEDLK